MYGPESCRGFPRVTVKQKPGQQTAIERNNIKVASFYGLINIAFIDCLYREKVIPVPTSSLPKSHRVKNRNHP